MRGYWLAPTEWLVLTVLAQRFLRRDPGATLLTSKEVVAELTWLESKKSELTEQQPGGWTIKKVEHLVKNVRERLAAQHVDGLVPKPGEIGYDSVYRRNLVKELIRSRTLTRDDLRLLGVDDDEDGPAGALVR